MNYYIPKKFESYELVDKATYKKLGNNSLLYCFDPRLLWTLDQIRFCFNKPVTVNNWCWGGKFQYRGFRPTKCNQGAKFSQHRFGRAIDFHIDGIDSQDIRNAIIKEQKSPCLKFITRIEDFKGMNWVHIDVANWRNEYIHIIVPKGKTSILK